MFLVQPAWLLAFTNTKKHQKHQKHHFDKKVVFLETRVVTGLHQKHQKHRSKYQCNRNAGVRGMKGGYLNAHFSAPQEDRPVIEPVCDPTPKTVGISPLTKAPANHRITRVYRVVVETNGIPKGMTIIDPSGDDLEGFRQSCCNRFGAERVVSIEPRS